MTDSLILESPQPVRRSSYPLLTPLVIAALPGADEAGLTAQEIHAHIDLGSPSSVRTVLLQLVRDGIAQFEVGESGYRRRAYRRAA